MKTIFKCLVRCCLVTSWVLVMPVCLAQDVPPEVGFVRIVNAVVPGVGNTSIRIDGENIFPKGYTLGQRTGGFGLKAGSHEIAIEKEGVISGKTKVALKTGETLTLIGFAEKVPAKDLDKPPVWKTKILRLKQSDPESGYRLAVVSLCPQDEIRVNVAGADQAKAVPLDAKRLVISSISLGKAKSDVTLTVDGEMIATLGTEDPGNYVVVLYEDENGKVKALSFYDPKFVIAG